MCAAEEVPAAFHGVIANTRSHTPQLIDVSTVTADWTSSGYQESTVLRMDQEISRFLTRLSAQGISSFAEVSMGDCREFVWSPTSRSRIPAIHTMHVRRSAIRALFSTAVRLGLCEEDPTLGLDVPPKTGRACRPLDADEMMLVQLTALARVKNPLRTASVVALAEATATTGELPQIRWRDVDLQAGVVVLPGASPVAARTGQLSDWGIRQLERFRQATGGGGDEPVVHRGRSAPDSHVGQASMSRMLGRLLADAGLTDIDVKPTSIRLYRPASLVAEGGRIEDAARMLGIGSLDAVAEAIGYQWREVA